MLAEIEKKQRWLAQELPRLRAQIEAEVRAETQVDHGLDAVIARAFEEPYDRVHGKTIGLRVPDDLRARLERQMDRGGHSYSHLVMVAIRIGVAAMEAAPPPNYAEPEMEPEQESVHHDADESSAEEAVSDPDFD